MVTQPGPFRARAHATRKPVRPHPADEFQGIPGHLIILIFINGICNIIIINNNSSSSSSNSSSSSSSIANTNVIIIIIIIIISSSIIINIIIITVIVNIIACRSQAHSIYLWSNHYYVLLLRIFIMRVSRNPHIEIWHRSKIEHVIVNVKNAAIDDTASQNGPGPQEDKNVHHYI